MEIIKKIWGKALWAKIILISLSLFLWPFVIGIGLALLIAKKINNFFIKGCLILPIILITFLFGTAWVAAIISPHRQEEKIKVTPSLTKKSLPTVIFTPTPTKISPFSTITATPTKKIARTPTPTAIPTPTVRPSPTPFPKPTLTPTSAPTKAKQVSLSVFEKHFIENFDYGQFNKLFTSSDNWVFFESTNIYGDELILAAIGEDLKNGTLKTGPNDTTAIQVVSFFMLGHPPLISSGWVEEAASRIKTGEKKATTLQGVDASIMLSPVGVWICSFTEK